MARCVRPEARGKQQMRLEVKRDSPRGLVWRRSTMGEERTVARPKIRRKQKLGVSDEMSGNTNKTRVQKAEN